MSAQDIRRALGVRGKQTCFALNFTPKLASSALLFHDPTMNRRHYERLSDRYAASMQRGEWQPNGETIKFSTEGQLLDGQHRLQAIVKSGKTVPLLVVLDISPDAFKTIDTGRARTASDVLAIHGEHNCVLLAAALRLLGCYRYATLEKENNYRMDHTLMLSLLDEEPNIRNSISPVHNGIFSYVQKLLRPRVAVFCHYILGSIDAEVTENFYYKLAEGLNLKKNEPVATLRTRLVDDLSAPIDMRLNATSQLAYVFIAFNATKKQEPLAKIKYTPFGKTPDKFPTLE